jgi:hypothetical protein
MKRPTFYIDYHGSGNEEERYAAYHLMGEPNVSIAIGGVAILTCYVS